MMGYYLDILLGRKVRDKTGVVSSNFYPASMVTRSVYLHNKLDIRQELLPIEWQW